MNQVKISHAGHRHTQHMSVLETASPPPIKARNRNLKQTQGVGSAAYAAISSEANSLPVGRDITVMIVSNAVFGCNTGA